MFPIVRWIVVGVIGIDARESHAFLARARSDGFDSRFIADDIRAMVASEYDDAADVSDDVRQTALAWPIGIGVRQLKRRCGISRF